MTNISKDSIFF